MAAAVVLATMVLLPAAARAEFGIASFSTAAINQDGSADFLAGSHPFSYSFDLAMNTSAGGEPEGVLRGLDVDLPPGLIGNPLAVPRCGRDEFDGFTPCAPGTQIGVMKAEATGLGTITLPIFNLIPPSGYVAAFGGVAAGNSFVELASLVGSGAGAHLRVSAPVLPGQLGIKHVTQTLWGVPADDRHDGERGKCLNAGGTCPLELPPAPLLTMPASCGAPLTTTLGIRSVEEPERTVTATSTLREGGKPQGMLDCEALSFRPTFALRTEGAALALTGLGIELGLPPNEAAFGRSAATLTRLDLELPAGLSLNPSAAGGLAGCVPDQIGLESAPGEAAARFDPSAPRCPEASKLGTAEVDTSVVDHPLEGNIYLATPGENPFGTRFAIYVVLDDPATGTLIKLPARLDADPGDGRIGVTVDRIPQLPLGDVQLDFAGGPRALLATPPVCGKFTATAQAVPSSAPEGVAADLRATFTLDRGAYSGPCPPSALPNAPGLQAGSAEAVAGLQTPFVLRVRREDASQPLSAFDLTLPPGLSASLAGVAICADTAMPACSASSAIGQATVGAGVGPSPLVLRGTAYLAGPYRGAPLSLLVAVPALAGPFDLGTVAVRAAVRVDPVTGQLSVTSDPLPQILGGVPLAIRSLSLSLDRPGFTHNPTSCEPMAIAGAATSTLGQVTPLATRFQLGECAKLGFEPRLGLRFGGATGRNGHPTVTATVRPRSGDANLRGAALLLPRGVYLDQSHIRGVCTRAELGAGRCPPDSVYGHLKAWTPLLDRPLEGDLYLREGPHRLPDLAADLDGQVHLVLGGRLTTPHARVRASFDALPDLPFSRLALTLRGGRRGLLVDSESVCSHRLRADAAFAGQNGRSFGSRPWVTAGCGAAKRQRGRG